jgi:hypothetical protein
VRLSGLRFPLLKVGVMSAPRRSITVTRTYKHEPEDCARALALLLNQSVMKVADEPTRGGLVGRDDVKESNGYVATQHHNK